MGSMGPGEMRRSGVGDQRSRGDGELESWGAGELGSWGADSFVKHVPCNYQDLSWILRSHVKISAMVLFMNSQYWGCRDRKISEAC